jgi:hypothetical protein
MLMSVRRKDQISLGGRERSLGLPTGRERGTGVHGRAVRDIGNNWRCKESKQQKTQVEEHGEIGLAGAD